MLRKLFILFGLIEILAPKPVISACERIGLENPENAQLRPGAAVLARLEGLLIVTVLVRGRAESPVLSKLLALTGAVAVVYPTPLIRASQSVAYENSRELQLRSWVKPATRLLGVLYLLVYVLSGQGETDVATAGTPEATPESS